MEKEDVIQQRLSEPFKENEIEWRVMRAFKAQNGKAYAYVAAYVESRAIMNRLDGVVGIGNWENEFREIHNGIICGITIHLPNGKSVTKWDGADLTNIEPTKGGLSGAFKRAAVQFGIGRYLYNLPETMVEIFPDTRQGKIYINDKKQKITGSWNPPNLPKWALPKNEQQPIKGKRGGSDSGDDESQRRTVTRFINKFEKAIGLDKPDYITRIFNKANGTNYEGLNLIRNASTSELQNYCKALKPVYNLVTIGQNYRINTDELVKFVQTYVPDKNIQNIYSCFFSLNGEILKNVEKLARDTFQQRQQKVS